MTLLPAVLGVKLQKLETPEVRFLSPHINRFSSSILSVCMCIQVVAAHIWGETGDVVAHVACVQGQRGLTPWRVQCQRLGFASHSQVTLSVLFSRLRHETSR